MKADLNPNESNTVISFDFANPLNVLLFACTTIFIFLLGVSGGEYYNKFEYSRMQKSARDNAEIAEQKQRKMVARWKTVEDFCKTYPTIEGDE